MALEKSHFGLRVRAIRWEKEKEKKKKRRRRRKKEEKNPGLGHLLCLEFWFGTSPLFGTCMFGNTCLSWVRKTLTFQYMCFWLV